MKASDSSPILNGMTLQDFDEKIAEARQRYMDAISEALDAELVRFMIPADRVSILQDAAIFATFLCVVKAAECVTPAGTPLERRTAMQQWWPIQKRIIKEVAPMLLEFGREAETRKVQGTGEVAS